MTQARTTTLPGDAEAREFARDIRRSIQLQAPAGSTRPVRFLQCRPY